MNLALQERLFQSYPLLFRKSGSEFDRLSIDQWGIEVANGWFELLDHLSAKLEKAIADLVADGIPIRDCPCAAQIKQKFGELRVHIDGRGRLPKYIDIDIDISDAERKANETCETCGNQGLLRKTSWIHVACDRCEQSNSDASINDRSSDADMEQHFGALEVLLENRSKNQ